VLKIIQIYLQTINLGIKVIRISFYLVLLCAFLRITHALYIYCAIFNTCKYFQTQTSFYSFISKFSNK